MNAFNPDVPEVSTKDPWYRVSHPISSFEGDKSAGVALAGLGDMVSSSLKVADQSVKEYLNNQVRNDTEALRAETTESAMALEDLLTGKTVVAQAGTAPLPVGPGQQPVPVDLESLPKTVQSIYNAKTARKDLETHYDAQLMAIAKRYRDQFPGYREYIDNVVSSVTGRDPANALLQGTLAKIQTLMAGQANKRDKVLDDITKEVNKGNPFAPALRKGYLAGAFSDEQVYDGINQFNQEEYKFAQDKRRLENMKGFEEGQTLLAKQIVSGRVYDIANRFWKLEATNAGLTADKIAAEIQAGNVKDPKLLQSYANVLQGQKAKFIQTMYDELNKPLADGRSIASRIPETELKALVAQGERMFDLNTQLVTSGEFGQAEAFKRTIDAMRNETQFGLFTDKDIGMAVRVMDVANKMGPAAGAFFNESVLTKYPNLGRGIGTFIDNKQKEMGTQPNSATGEVSTLSDTWDQLKKAPGGNLFIPATVTATLDQATSLTNLGNSKEEREIKRNMLIGLFHPKNMDNLANFEREGYSIKDGKEVSVGQYSVYAKLANDKMAAVAYDIGKDDPRVWEMYKNWVSNTFANQMFKEELQDFSDAAKWVPNPNIKIGWDDQNHRFVARPAKPVEYDSTSTGILDRSKIGQQALKTQVDALNRRLSYINEAIKPITNIAKLEGRNQDDVNADVLEWVGNYASGIDFSNPAFSDIPEKMMKSIADTRRNAQRRDEELKAAATKKKGVK